LPGVPTFLELGYPPEFDWAGFVGLVAPARTPPAVQARLIEAFRAVMRRQDLPEWLAELDVVPGWMGPDEVRADIAARMRQWTDLVRRTGITAE